MTKLICTFLLLICSSAFAQQRPLTDKAVAKLVENYNQRDWPAMYDQYAESSKSMITPEFNLDFYKVKLGEPLGKIKAWKYVDEVKANANYHITFEHGRLELKIAVNGTAQITYFEWRPLKPQKEIPNPKNAALIKTNNPKQTKLQLYADSLALDYLKDPNNSSLSIGIVTDGNTETIYYGETERGNGTLPDGRSLYEIGSLTKTFVATLLAHAVNEKKISLNDDIRKYLPGSYPNLQYNGLPIKVLNLANHTSALPRLPGNFAKVGGYNPANPYQHYSKEMIFEYLKTFKPDTLAGTRMEYSNFGFAVLGIILENVYHQPLEELLKQTITAPLKMTSTSLVVPEANRKLLVSGYSDIDGKYLQSWEMGAFNAAGGLKSNMQDLLIFLKTNLNSVSPDFALTRKETDKQAEISTGLAWMIQPFRGTTCIWHNGAVGGFTSFCGFIKDRKAGVVVLSNSSASVDEIALELLSFAIQNPVKTK